MNKSQRKGKSYVRYIAKKFSMRFDCDVRRVPCSGALDIKGDLRNLYGPLEQFVIECKKQEHINIWACMVQTVRQATSKIGVLVFSKNNMPDYVCMTLDDWMDLVEKTIPKDLVHEQEGGE